MPSTELYHTAQLVTVLPTNRSLDISNAGSIAVMMVSPEGVVKYWPSLAQDSNCIELDLDLSGHPSHALTPFQVSCFGKKRTNGKRMKRWEGKGKGERKKRKGKKGCRK